MVLSTLSCKLFCSYLANLFIDIQRKCLHRIVPVWGIVTVEQSAIIRHKGATMVNPAGTVVRTRYAGGRVRRLSVMQDQHSCLKDELGAMCWQLWLFVWVLSVFSDRRADQSPTRSRVPGSGLAVCQSIQRGRDNPRRARQEGRGALTDGTVSIYTQDNGTKGRIN